MIPLGTHFIVPGYGEAVAADTGSAIIGARIDLWFPTARSGRRLGPANRHDLDPLKGLALPSNRLRLLPNLSDGEVIDLIEPPEPTTTSPTRVLLVDDNDLFRTGLRTLLEEEKVDVVGEARTGADALVEIGNVAPDVVVMDLNMPGMSGVEAIRQMAAIAPRTRVLVLTASHEDADVMDAIMAGACGYLVKDSSIHELLTGIRAAANGESLISPAIASKVLQQLRDRHLAAARSRHRRG